MEIFKFKNISDTDSILHRLDGRIKTIIFFSGIIIATVLSHWYLVAGLWLVAIFSFSITKISWRNLLKRLSIPFGISWLVFLNLIFTNGKHTILIIHLGPIILKAYTEGLQLGILIQFRIMVAVTLGCLLSFSTPMIEILETLRLCKLPNIIIDLADMMYRYVFIIGETAHNMRRAQLSRMGDSVSLIKQASDTGKIAGFVIIKSIDRSTKIYNAMLSRGYNENSRDAKFFTKAIPKKDYYFGVLIIILLITLFIINMLF